MKCPHCQQEICAEATQITSLFNNRDFGTIHIQRFEDSDVRRVHVMSSTVCKWEKADERGVRLIDPFVDVMTDAEIPGAIETAWKKLRLRWHYGTGRFNAWGVFICEPPPADLAGVTAESLDLIAERATSAQEGK